MSTRRVRHVWPHLARLIVFALAALPPVAAPMRVAHAASTIVVDDTSGTAGGNGCTLRDAITAANTDAPAGGCPAGSSDDVIDLPAGATITLTVADNGEGAEINGLPPITSTITINGNNAIVERSSAAGTPSFRIFYVKGTLTLNSITVRNGKTSVDIEGRSGSGGGIKVDGALTVNNSTISGNSTGDATGSSYPGGGGGIGGMYSSMTSIVIRNSTISGNSTGSAASGLGGWGGGIDAGRAKLIVTNSTISGNAATGPISSGGGIVAISMVPHRHYIVCSTITGNSAGTGGGIYLAGLPGYLTVSNTIIAMNTAPVGPNCNDLPDNYGNNIDSGTSCGWGGTYGSMSNTDPLLGPLANNGGPTWTHSLLPSSPAIDAGTDSTPLSCPPTDQRGVVRPQGAGYDIGAFELEPPRQLFLPAIIKY